MDMLDHLNVDKVEIIKKEELSKIEGGLSVSGALINSFTGAIKILLELGRSLGTSIRRMVKGKYCSL